MTKQRLKMLRSLLDEFIGDQETKFAHDCGCEIDDQEFQRLAKQYLGQALPRLGEIRNDRGKRAQDAEDRASQFESACRELRLRLQRGQ